MLDHDSNGNAGAIVRVVKKIELFSRTLEQDPIYQERQSLQKSIEKAAKLEGQIQHTVPRQLLLYGLGGSGKSQAALHFFQLDKTILR